MNMINRSTKYIRYQGIDKRNVFVCLSLSQSVFLAAWLSVSPSVNLSFWLSVCLSLCQFVRVCPSVNLFFSVIVCLSISPSISRRLIQCSGEAIPRQCLSPHNSKAVPYLFWTRINILYKNVLGHQLSPPVLTWNIFSIITISNKLFHWMFF